MQQNLEEINLINQSLFKKEEDPNSGLSMKELFEQKRLAAEKALEEAKEQGKIENNEERKNRLLA